MVARALARRTIAWGETSKVLTKDALLQCYQELNAMA
jgi:hypothetical protein